MAFSSRIIGGDHIPSGGQNAADAVLTDDKGEPYEYDYEYYDETPPASPFVNPYDPSHQKEHLLAGNLAGHLAGVYQVILERLNGNLASFQLSRNDLCTQFQLL